MSSLSVIVDSSQRLALSAREEALLAGRPLVGVEDLFLALFSAGGESSRRLAGAGVDLAAARAAVGAVHADRIAVLGIHADQPPPRAPSQRESTSALVDFSEPALRVLGDLTAYDDDRHVLVATLDSADGVVADVLERLGVDVSTWCDHDDLAKSTATSAAVPSERPMIIRDEVGRWLRVTVPWHLPAPEESIRALVSDPGRWGSWNDHEGELDFDTLGTVTVTDPEPSRPRSVIGTRRRRSRHRLVDLGDPNTIRWETATETVTPTGGRRPSRHRLEIQLEAAPSGTTVLYTCDWLLRRGPGRVGRRVLSQLLGSRVRVRANAIARLLSDRTDRCE